MNPQPRYAIYFVPGADTALYRFGASVLGYDCYTGQNAAAIGSGDSLPWGEIVREPRVYGFHATLKAPFRLAAGMSEADLADAALAFAADRPAVLVGDLIVRELGSFIALVPKAHCSLLNRFAQACVREFDRFRAPMTEAERAHRLATGLSTAQIDNLKRWGYPYVFEDFRFHMTLTGSLALPDRSLALRILNNHFDLLRGAHSLTIDRIVVARQSEDTTPFQVIQIASLGQSAYRPFAYSF